MAAVARSRRDRALAGGSLAAPDARSSGTAGERRHPIDIGHARLAARHAGPRAQIAAGARLLARRRGGRAPSSAPSRVVAHAEELRLSVPHVRARAPTQCGLEPAAKLVLRGEDRPVPPETRVRAGGRCQRDRAGRACGSGCASCPDTLVALDHNSASTPSWQAGARRATVPPGPRRRERPRAAEAVLERLLRGTARSSHVSRPTVARRLDALRRAGPARLPRGGGSSCSAVSRVQRLNQAHRGVMPPPAPRPRPTAVAKSKTAYDPAGVSQTGLDGACGVFALVRAEAA